MGFEYRNNSLLLSGQINANDFNEVIRFYQKISSFQYSNHKNIGDLITAGDWQDLSNHVQDLRNYNYTIPLVPSGFMSGSLITRMSWSNAIYKEVTQPGITYFKYQMKLDPYK